MTLRTIGLVLAVLSAMVPESFAQGILTLSDGRSAIIPYEGGYLTADFTESAIGTHLHWEFVGDVPTIVLCGQQVAGIPNHRQLTADLTFAAEKGKRALFSKGQFTPGIDLAPGFALFWEHTPTAPDCTHAPDAIDARGTYDALYIGFVQTVVGNDVVLTPPGGPITLETDATKNSSAAVTYNHYFGRGQLLGASARFGKEWLSPGNADPLQTCVQAASGLDVTGNAVVVSNCTNMYVGPLSDLTTTRLRLDYEGKLRPIAWKDKPQIGVYASLSTVSQTGLNTVYNVAVGPTLHPKNKPRQILGAFLIEGTDLFNANGKHPQARDRWTARLYATVPF